MWGKITEEVNAIGICFRTEDEVRNKYRNMSRGAEGKYFSAKKHARVTGGGPPVPTNKQVSEANGVDGGIETSVNISGKQRIITFTYMYMFSYATSMN